MSEYFPAVHPRTQTEGVRLPEERRRIETFPPLELKAGVATRPSSDHPERNEDTLFVSQAQDVACVCDGLGGAPGGDWASQTATHQFQPEALKSVQDDDLRVVFGPSQRVALSRSLVEQAACQMLMRMDEAVRSLRARPEMQGLFKAWFLEKYDERFDSDNAQHQAIARQARSSTATTASFVKIWHDERGLAFVTLASVGDSRIYRLRGGRLERMTKDHSPIQTLLDLGLIDNDQDLKQLLTTDMVDVALSIPDLSEQDRKYLDILKRMISHEETLARPKNAARVRHGLPRGVPLARLTSTVVQSIGNLDHLREEGLSFHPFIATEAAQPGDAYVVLSDGVTDNLTDSAILDIAQRYADQPEALACALIDAAFNVSQEWRNIRSKPDDISAACVRLQRPAQAM